MTSLSSSEVYANIKYMEQTARSGFTIIELLVAVSIITILSGALIPGFTNYSKNQNLRQAQEQVKNDLRTAQANALTGTNASPTLKHWGIRFTQNSGTYEYFTSENTTDCGNGLYYANKTTQPLAAGIVVRSPSGCVYFSFANGDASADSSITLGYPSPDNTVCRLVTIDSGGLVLTGGDAVCP